MATKSGSGSLSDGTLLDAQTVFTDVLSKMMLDMGMSFETQPKDVVLETISQCTEQYRDCWEEFMEWVYYDKAERTRRLIRSGIAASRKGGHL